MVVATKKKRNWVTDSMIKEASKVDIIDYARQHGYELNLNNKYGTGVEHDSLVINREKNTFYWYSRDFGGGSIKFAETFMDLSFQDAVRDLTGKEYQKAEYVEIPKEPFKFKHTPAWNTKKVENYLINQRKIDPEIVSSLIKTSYLKQNSYGDCVFTWNKTGRIVGADEQGTVRDEARFGNTRGTKKMIMKNSESNYGFNVTLGTPKALYFFEAPVDLLSYWSMNKELKDCRLISMNGAKEQTVVNFLNQTIAAHGVTPTDGIYLGVDNDFTGHKLMEKFRKISFQDVETKKDVKFKNLIAGDTQINKHFFDMYQDLGTKHNLDWKILAAIHKAETNMGTTNEPFEKGMGYFLGTYERNNKSKPVEIDVYDSLNKCAEAIKPFFDGENYQGFKIYKDNEGKSIDSSSKLTERVVYYFEKYSNEGYKLVDEVLKDWNDLLKDSMKNEKPTEKMENLKIESTMIPVKEVEYQHENGTYLVFVTNDKKFQAEIKNKTEVVGFFEGDSPEEIEQLIKIYGYESVEKNDVKELDHFKQNKEKNVKSKNKEKLNTLQIER